MWEKCVSRMRQRGDSYNGDSAVCIWIRRVCVGLFCVVHHHTHTDIIHYTHHIYTHSCTAHFWERVCVLSVQGRPPCVCAGINAILLRECVFLGRCVRSDDLNSEVRRSRKKLRTLALSASINAAGEIMDHLWGSCEGWHLEWSGSGA